MRMAFAFLIACVCVTTLPAQEKLGARFGIDPDLDNFPQKTPKETLASIIAAIPMRKIDYLVAQLADPAWVDKRVKEVHGGKFEEMVKETSAKLIDDPETVAQMRRFLKEAEWEDAEDTSSAKLKDTKDRLFFKKLDGRWFLENRRAAGK